MTQKDKPTLTQLIFNSISPWDNPYQGTDKKILFVCSAGILRSPTAARIFSDRFNTRSCGSQPYALIRISGDLISWTDEIVFMKQDDYDYLKDQYDWDNIKENKKVIILNIRDMYDYMSDYLVESIKEQYIP